MDLDIVRKLYFAKYLSSDGELDEEKKDIILSNVRNKCIIAGPGTGKTFVLQHLIIYEVLFNDAIPRKICALSFNKDIATELKTQTDNLAQENKLNVRQSNISTIHALALNHSKYAHFHQNGKYKLVLNKYSKDVDKHEIDFVELLFTLILPDLGYSKKSALILYDFDEDKIKKEILKTQQELIATDDKDKKKKLSEFIIGLKRSLKEREQLAKEKFIKDIDVVKNFICQFENDPVPILERITIDKNKTLADLTKQLEKEKFEIRRDGIQFIIDVLVKSYKKSILLLNILILFTKIKKEKNWFDFNDALIDCRNTLKFLKKTNYPEYADKTYDFLVVDEFQDVNPLHMEIILLILSEKSKIVVVGDPRQSIYGWNGSDVRFIKNFKNDFIDSELFNLTRCYRCPEKVVNLANALTSAEGYSSIKSIDECVNKDSNKIPCLEFSSFNEEAKFWSKFIVDWLLLKLKYSPKDIILVSRTNDPLEVLQKILQANINYNRELLAKNGYVELKVHFNKKDGPISKSEILDDKINLMSVHCAKGLEAKVVIFIQACDMEGKEKEYLTRIIGEFGNVYEENNIFYVATTRTKKDLLFFSYSSPNFKGFNSPVSEFISKNGNLFDFSFGVLDDCAVFANKYANENIYLNKFEKKVKKPIWKSRFIKKVILEVGLSENEANIFWDFLTALKFSSNDLKIDLKKCQICEGSPITKEDKYPLCIHCYAHLQKIKKSELREYINLNYS